ncbi:MAG: 3-isopropylmalate dehydratase small subunit [Clostridiales bacterium]|nr:3-isopropylmalate dehydratase small subunit [Clostridiales bacterium]
MSNIHIYGDHVDTDIIIPAKYLNEHDPDRLKLHCMEPVDETFPERVKKNDFMIAGVNFGCGSSREHAPIAIKALGIKCVIAKSFARIFFRNAINIGLPVIESEEIVNDIHANDVIHVDFVKGRVENKTQNKTYDIPKFPEFMMAIIEKGGVIPFIKE